MKTHINDLIAKGAEESDLEQNASEFLDDTLGESSATIVDTWLVLGQLDPLETVDGQPRWTEAQQQLIIKANDSLDPYIN